jgi:hypothetical protein
VDIIHLITKVSKILVIAVFYLTTLLFSNDTKLFAKNTASIKAHGLQVELSPASTSSGDIIYFTTYDGKSSTPLIDSSASGYVLSEEFKPLSFGSSTFVADYGSLNSYGQIADYGAVSLAMPTTDSDSNGIPDWLQIDMSVNANVSGSYALHYNETGFYPSDSTLTGKFTRSSENTNGNYSITFFIGGSDSYTYSGVWHIDYHYGTVQYDDDSYSINTQTLNSDGRLDQVIGSYKYSNSSTDSLNLGKINLIDPDGIVQLKEGLLQRTGNSYSGYAKAVDGYAVTSWADYLDFYVEIVDTNDGDRDGIPDFTDPVKPFLYTAGSDLSLGWRSLDWFGAYFPFSSGWIFHSEHGWIYSQSGSLVSFWFWHPAYNWCWTNENVYPWVWFHNKQIWKYFFKSSGEWVTEPDTAKPKLDLLGGSALKLEAGQIWKEPGATAYDERDGDITVNINIIGKVDMNTPNTYILKYSVADAAGNEANATRSVTVVDTTDPVLTLLGDANITHAKNTAWVDPGATASDSLDGNLTNSITIAGTVNVNAIGVYDLIYSVADAAGNEANATRSVTVVDTTDQVRGIANIKIYGLQVDLSNAVTNLGGIIYFTSYDGLSSTPLLDNELSGPIFSGELKPLSFGFSTFVTDYGTANIWGNIAEYGAVALSMPSTDSDSNGVPDWLQIDLSVNTNVSGSSELHYIEPGVFSGDSTISGSFTRSAGSSAGNYNLTYTISGLGSITATGVWYVESYDGSIEYDGSSYSINVSTENYLGITEQSTGSSDYSIIDQDNLGLKEIFITDSDGVIQLQEGSLSRTGNSYSGFFKAVDGYLTTSWADYLDWYVEIIDTNDGDGDGVPDFTDPVETE